MRPPDGRAWDLLVVGAGTAGLVGSRTAARLGASVLLVERDRFGGDCLWTGCVPSKSLLASAGIAADARAAHRLGVHVEGVRVDLEAVFAHVHGAIAAIEPVDSPDAARAAGVSVRTGQVRFTGPSTAEIDGRPVSFRRALLATGSEPVTPEVPGLEPCDPLTSDTVWDPALWNGTAPARLLVVGGGAVGCELSQAFARLGVGVTLVEAGPRLLAGEHPDASAIVTDALRTDGVDLHLGTTLVRVEPGAVAGSGDAVLDGARVSFDRVLVAAGRRARTAGLGLDHAAVALRCDGSVVTGTTLRTTNRRIFAAGDVTGRPAFTHVAAAHAATAASNAVLGLRRAAADRWLPRVTYTSPEVAAFGAADPPSGGRLRVIEHADLDRAVVDGRTAGFTRLTLDARGRLVGATIVGPRAGECLGELVLAAQRGLRARDLAAVVHPYPTYADASWRAAVLDLDVVLDSRPVRAATRLLLRAQRLR